jgi:hypothetical protein
MYKKNNIIRLVFSFISFVFFISSGYSQVTQEWAVNYNGPGVGDYITCMRIDFYGNVYVTGRSSGVNTYSDFATVKYSTSGIQQWAARYSGGTGTGNTIAEAFSLSVDLHGNVYVTGDAPPPGSNTQAKWTTIKYDHSGVQQWIVVYNGVWPAINVPCSMTTDDNSNVYITGYSYFDTTAYDYTTIKYDSSGAQQWIARYRNPDQDYAKKIVVDNSGNVHITGYSRGDTTYNDIATVKYNSSGIQQWVARYNGPGNLGDSATALAVDDSGNVYVAGRSWGGDGTGYDYITIKYNSYGVQQWAERYNGSGNWTDAANSIAVDNSGNVYVTGYTDSGSPHYWDIATVKYNAAGIQQWVATYNNGSQDFGVALTLDNQGNIYVVGETSPILRTHFAIIKYSPAGVQKWAVVSNVNPNGESPVAIAVDSLYNVYVAGSDGHYLTIKYNQLIGITPVSNEVPEEYRLYQNYPNPFNPTTKIKFSIPLIPPLKGDRGMVVKLTIYDLLGREVTKLVNQPLQPGTYEVTWDGTDYPSGVYFYKIEAGSFTDTKKLVLLK